MEKKLQVVLGIGKLSPKLDQRLCFRYTSDASKGYARDPACSLIDNNNQTFKNKKGGSSSELKRSSDSSPFVASGADCVSKHAPQTIKGVAEASLLMTANLDGSLLSSLVMFQGDGHVKIALLLQTSRQVAFDHVFINWEKPWILFKHLGDIYF